MNPGGGTQFAPLWPSSCLATTWHSRLQNHAFRHRPQSRSLPALLPQAWHEVAAVAMDEALVAPNWVTQYFFFEPIYVVLVLVESLGGAAPDTVAALELLATRLKAPGAKDGTHYSYARSGPKSFVLFHLQQLSKAAVAFDARAINVAIIDHHAQADGMPLPHGGGGGPNGNPGGGGPAPKAVTRVAASTPPPSI